MRSLRPEETREVTATARRLAALALLRPALDANYSAIKQTDTPGRQPRKDRPATGWYD